MREVAYNAVLEDEVGRITVTTRPKRNAVKSRLEAAGADYSVETHKINGEFDTAIFTIDQSDLRHIKYLIRP